MKVDEPVPLSFASVTVMVAVRAAIAIAKSSSAQIAAKRIRMIRFSMGAPK
jgi:hypothetical protein